MEAVVVCLSSAAYADRPLAFEWGGRRLEVHLLLAAWRTPAGKVFRVSTADGEQFELAYNEPGDEWRIQAL
jgi:hypothetical protein